MKHKNKIILSVLIIAVLAFTCWWGGNSPLLRGWNTDKIQVEEKQESTTKELTEVSTDNLSEKIEQSYEQKIEINKDKSESEQQTDATALEKTVADEKANSVDKQEFKSGNNNLTCIISVRCENILKNMKYFNQEKIEYVPKNGIILKEKEVVFYEGESVFNVTLREMKKNRIQFEFVNTPVYNSAYIEGIDNIYEFDCGELSGWIYKVNGVFPNYGCSRHILKQGDKIEWVYTCDSGYDVGSKGGFQKDD